MTNQADVECPYCDHWQDICHDDGYGYEQDETYHQECEECGKTFTFTTSVVYRHEARKANCLNGGDHRWRSHVGLTFYYPDAKRCTDCDLEERGEYRKPVKDDKS